MKVPVLPPRIPIYINDGLGRDTYISFYNGGFGHYKYSKSYKKDEYEVPSYKNHPDLFKRRPIDRYQMSGEGRDYFIYKGIQTEHDRISDNSSFERTLRKDDSPREYQLSYRRPRNKFEKKLINRIFYGKCPGMKDRQMSPKVKFKEDIEREREKEKEDSFNNSFNMTNMSNSKINVNNTMTIEINKESNNTSLGNTFLKTNKINRDGKDTLYNVKKNNLLYTPINPNTKRSLCGSGTINADKSDNLINSVRKIFLYNSKIKI
jgi:hypothetical protein